MGWWRWNVGRTGARRRPANSVIREGWAEGGRAMCADSVSQPLIFPVSSEYSGEEARVRISAPPMEWPITKTGTGHGSWEDMMWERSDMTRVVGPVRPFSEGVWTDWPHPRWSKENTVMDFEARVGKRE